LPAVTTRLYERGLDAVESIDPYAGLLSSLHFSGFFTSHWDWHHGHRLPILEGAEGEAVDRFVALERERQRRLRERLGVGGGAADRVLMCGYFWLQLWDRISLDVCRHGFGGWSGDYPPAPVDPAPGAETVRLHVALEPGGVCRLDPYPLLALPFRARVPAALVPPEAVADPAELRRAWRAGGVDSIDVTFLGPR
jgi:hypothetical protein